VTRRGSAAVECYPRATPRATENYTISRLQVSNQACRPGSGGGLGRGLAAHRQVAERAEDGSGSGWQSRGVSI